MGRCLESGVVWSWTLHFSQYLYNWIMTFCYFSQSKPGVDKVIQYVTDMSIAHYHRHWGNLNIYDHDITFINMLQQAKRTTSTMLVTLSHWHVFTWIWETHLALYQQAVINGREIWAGRNLSHWIIESAVYLQPIKRLIISTKFFPVLTKSGWSFALCIAWCSQQWWHI